MYWVRTRLHASRCFSVLCCWTAGLWAPSGAWLWCSCHPPAICQLHLLQPPPGDDAALLWAVMQNNSLSDRDRVLIPIKWTLMWLRQGRFINLFFSRVGNMMIGTHLHIWRKLVKLIWPETSAKYGFSSPDLYWKWAPPFLLFCSFQIKIRLQKTIPGLCNLKLFSVNYASGLSSDLGCCCCCSPDNQK